MVKSFHIMKYSFIILITGIQMQTIPGKQDEFLTIEKKQSTLLSSSSTTHHNEQAKQFNGLRVEYRHSFSSVVVCLI